MSSLATAVTLLPFRPFLRDVASLLIPVEDHVAQGLSVDLSDPRPRGGDWYASLFLCVAATRWGTERLSFLCEADAWADIMRTYRFTADQMDLLNRACGSREMLDPGTEARVLGRAVRQALKGVQF